ncbi:hypothetical protein [Chloroflexus sp. Y-396-1]|uniref:hypothetical protein n=1 Tax=Chloroflexus sp. Y-396-1 TaxID=867845 RepID=UPI00048AE727|nr:hypothetical protein [Chloroflexus sp. Y-396-1]
MPAPAWWHADGITLGKEEQYGGSLIKGCVMIDDTTLDKPHSQAIEPPLRHRSGNHHRVVLGVNPIRIL